MPAKLFHNSDGPFPPLPSFRFEEGEGREAKGGEENGEQGGRGGRYSPARWRWRGHHKILNLLTAFGDAHIILEVHVYL